MEAIQIAQKLDEIVDHLISQKEVFNIDEFCQFTGLTKSTVYKKTSKGQIPHYKQAKHLFFDRSEVIQWLKANRGLDASAVEKQASTYVALGGE